MAILERRQRGSFQREERLRKLMQQELAGLSEEEFKARVDEITKGADEFVKGAPSLSREISRPMSCKMGK